MNNLLRLSLASFLACSSFVATALAQSSTTLKVGIPIEREMGLRQSHKFTVQVEANDLLQLIVEQKGIDVIVSVAGPDGNAIGNYDTPNGPNGPEHVSFVATTAGNYSITVEPLDPANATKGRYEIKVVETRKATEQEQKSSQNRQTARTKGVELLRELEGTISQIKTPATRIKSRIKAADLLWEVDEKRASKYIADATTELKELIASIDSTESDFTLAYPVIWQLRFEMIQLLLEIDPEKALNLLYSTTPPAGPYAHEQSSQEGSLELTIANRIMDRDPQRSLQIARQSLKQGYAPQLVHTVNELQNRDPKLAAELANDICNKLLTEKLAHHNEAGQLALNLLGATYADGNSISIGEKPPRVLPDDKSKELLQKVLNEALTFSQTGASVMYQAPIQWQLLNRLRSMGGELDKIIPGSMSAVEKKFSEILPGFITPVVAPQLNSGTVDEVLETIENAPVESRDQLYYLLANREAAQGNSKRAKELINANVKTPWQRRDWLRQIDQQELSQVVNSGKFEDALRTIGALRTPSERATYLSQLVSRIQTDPKPVDAVNLLEQARALLPASPLAQDEEQMNALFEIARAFSEYDSKRSFEIMDPLVDQFNEICAAARMLQGFGGDFFLNDELTEDGTSLSATGNQMASVIGGLALTNFERAKSTSDRIRLPELRLRAYLEIAQQSLEGQH